MTAIIFHRIDLDGWFSCAIAMKYYNAIDKPFKLFPYHYGDPIPDTSDCSDIVMLDVSFKRRDMLKLIHDHERVLLIDHHISAIKDLSDLMDEFANFRIYGNDIYSACEHAWRHFFPLHPIPMSVLLVGAYDSFRHRKMNIDAIADIVYDSEESQESFVLKCQYGFRTWITNQDEALNHLITMPENTQYQTGNHVYRYLWNEARTIYNSGYEIVIHEHLSIGRDILPRRFKVINRERFNPINFGIDYHNEGYDGIVSCYFDGTVWNVSIYNDNNQIDCSAIAKRFGGGGHKGAAGCRIANLESLSIR